MMENTTNSSISVKPQRRFEKSWSMDFLPNKQLKFRNGDSSSRQCRPRFIGEIGSFIVLRWFYKCKSRGKEIAVSI